MKVLKQVRRVFETSLERPYTPSLSRTVRFALMTGAVDVLVTRRFRVINQGRFQVKKGARLRFGTAFFGFLDGSETSLIRNRGIVNLTGSVSVGGGARWDIGPDALLTIGDGTRFSPDTTIVATDQISIGDHCAVSWDVQILDADFHAHGTAGMEHELPDAALFCAPVSIGNHVWVGSGVMIYKGVRIADDCIIAGGSIVTRSVNEPGSLIAGNPARIVKTGVVWR